ncbi:unnamed protein product, partial [Closterium sp. NIES-54]
ETSVVAVSAARGTPRTPFLEGCSPSPLAPSYASTAAVDVLGAEDVGAASAVSGKRRNSKGKGGKSGGGGSGSGSGGDSGGGGGSGGGGSGRSGGGSGGFGGGGGGSSRGGGSGSSGGVGSRVGAVLRGGSGAGQRQQQQRRNETPSPQQLREWFAQRGASREGGCYLCVPPDPGIEAAALGASESSLPGTAPAEALHIFTLDSGASRCFFRYSTTLTPLPAPVPVTLADPSGELVLARSSTVLPCPAVPSGSLSGLHLPSFSTNLVSTAALQDAMVTTTTPGGQRVSICTCTRMGRHLATFTRRPGSSLYTLATKPPHVAASAQVSASGPVAPPCSCRFLSHQTLLWHHRLGHPSLPCLRGMHSGLLVSGLPRSLPPLPPSPDPPCLPCVEGRQRAAPHSSSSPPSTAPLQTLHMDVWGPALRLQLRERFHEDLPVLRLHSDRVGEFSSDLLRDFCRGEGILQSFTLPASAQRNGIAERRIGLVMEVARTSMIHAVASPFLWPFAVWYATHQLKLWPLISLPETSPTLRWTGKVDDASVFRVWGSHAFVCDTSADKLSALAFPCVFLGFPLDAPGWQFYHPTSRYLLPSQDVTFDESVPFYRLFPYRSAPLPPPLLFLSPGPPLVDPLPPQGPAPSGVSQVEPLLGTVPVEVAVDSGAARGAASGGVASRGAEPARAESGVAEPGGAKSEGVGSGGAELGSAKPGGAEPRVAEPEGAEPGGAESEGAESGGAEPRGTASFGGPAGALPRLSPRPEPLSPLQLRKWFSRRTRLRSGAAGAGDFAAGGTGAGGVGATSLGGAGVPARAGGPGGAGGAGPRGAHTRGTGAGGGDGAAGAGGGTEAAGPGGARTGGTGAGGAAGVGAGDPGAGDTEARGAGPGGAGAVGVGSGDTGRPRPYFVPLLQQRCLVPYRRTLAARPSTLGPMHLPPQARPSTQGPARPPLQARPSTPYGPPVSAASGGAEPGGAESEGAGSGGAEPGDAELGGAEPASVEPGGAEPEGVEPGGAESKGAESGPLSLQQLRKWFAQRTRLWSGAAGAGDSATGDPGARDAGVTAGAGGTGGAAADGPGGARTRGTGATGTDGVEGTGARDPTEPGTAGAGATGAGGAGAGGAGAGAGDPAETGGAGAGGAGAGGTSAGGAGAGGAGAGDTGALGAGAGGTGAGGAGAVGARAGDTRAVDPGARGAGAGGAVSGGTGAGGTVRSLLSPPPLQLQPQLQPGSPLPAPSPYAEQKDSFTERRKLESRPASPVHAVRPSRRVPRPRPPPVPSTHALARRPSSVPLHFPLLAPPESSLPAVPHPESDLARAANPTVSRLLTTAVTDPSFEFTAASALVAELLEFAAACCLDYTIALVAESASASPPSVGGECALGTDVLEERQEDFECLAAAVPRFASMLLAPEGNSDAPYIPTPRSYAEVITGPYSSQWQAAMDAEMASWKSTGTYVDEVPPFRVNIVDGIWSFGVKRPPGSPPAFKALYVARGFSQRQGVDYFQNFSPTPKMTTLWVLLHVAAQHDYELHSLDFNTAFLQGSLHEEIWLRRPPGFTGSFLAGT